MVIFCYSLQKTARLYFIAFLNQCFFNENGNFDNFEKFMNDIIENNPNLPELKEIREEWRNYKEKK